MNELVVMVGIAGIGKSTYVQENFADYHCVSLDEMNRVLSPVSGFHERNLDIERQVQEFPIRDCLAHGRPVVVDNTNLTIARRRLYVDLAKEYGAYAQCLYFEPDLERALRQNAKRLDPVPAEVIRRMAEVFEIPTLGEGFYKVSDIK